MSRLAAAGMPTCSSSSVARARAALWSSLRCSRSVSVSWNPIVKHGLRLVVGSWKIIATSLPMSLRRSWSEMLSRSRPPNWRRFARDAAGVGDEPHHRQHGHALAGTGLPDDAEHLAFVEREGHAVHRAQEAALRGKLDVEVLDLEQCHGRSR